MRVPVYERRQGIAPMSGIAVSPAYSPSDNGASTAQVVGNLAVRLQKMHEDTEDARTLELLNKLKADSQEYHENPDKGIYNTRLGYQAQGIYREADEWLRRKGEEYASDLGTRAKSNFRRMAEEYIQQRGLANSRFEADQMKKYQAEQSDAAIKNGLNEVAGNPYDDEAVGRAKQNMFDALELKMRWSSPEARKNALAEMENNIAAARLNVMMRDDPIKAEKWFSENKKSFTPDNAVKFQQAIENATEIYKIQNTVDQLVKKFPQGHEAEALKWIRENFSGDIEERVASAFKTRANEIAIDENRENKFLKQQQNELEEEIERNFYLNGTLPTDNEFRYLVENRQLRTEQAERLQNKGNIYATRSRIEKQILASNPDLSQMELDTAVMRRMGTTQEEYKRIFADLVQGLMSKKYNDNALNDYYQRGKIAKQDIETIKKYLASLDEIQKNFYQDEVKNLKKTITDLTNAGLPQKFSQSIIDEFTSRAITNLNPRDKNYRENLLTLKRHVLIDAIDKSGERLNGYLWGSTDLGEAYQKIQNDNLETRGGFDPFSMLPDISPSNIDLSSSAIPAGANIPLSMVAGGVIPKGGGFTAPRVYRGGTHNGLDIAAPAGTDIVMQDFGANLTVSKVNTATPTKGAGNSITLEGDYETGDHIEITLGHMQNNSIGVNVGDTVNVGDVIGKIGNTGMTSENGKITAWREDKKTGYHLDVKIKVNGQYVDPAKFRPPERKQDFTKKTTPEELFTIPNYEDL